MASRRPAVDEDRDITDVLYDQLSATTQELSAGLMLAQTAAKENFRATAIAVQPFTKVDKLVEMKAAFDKLRATSADPLIHLVSRMTSALDDVRVQVKAYGRLQKVIKRVTENKLSTAMEAWKECAEPPQCSGVQHPLSRERPCVRQRA